MKTLSRIAISLILVAGVLVGSPAEAQQTYRCPQWHRLLREYKLPVQVFDPIMWRESRCQPHTVGWNYKTGTSKAFCRWAPVETYKRCAAVSSYDSGLLQINSSWKTLTSKTCRSVYGDLTVLLNPRCNLKVASVLYANGKGMSNWRGVSGIKK